MQVDGLKIDKYQDAKGYKWYTFTYFSTCNSAKTKRNLKRNYKIKDKNLKIIAIKLELGNFALVSLFRISFQSRFPIFS